MAADLTNTGVTDADERLSYVRVVSDWTLQEATVEAGRTGILLQRRGRQVPVEKEDAIGEGRAQIGAGSSGTRSRGRGWRAAGRSGER